MKYVSIATSLVYVEKNLDLIEVGTLRISGVGAQGVLEGVIKFLPYDWLIMT